LSLITAREMRPELAAVVAAYDAIAEPGFETRGAAINYRQIKPPRWPGPAHYELLSYADSVSIELHLESDAVAPLRGTLEPMVALLVSRYPTIAWEPKWSSGRGRLCVRVQGASPRVVAETMKSFIAETKKLVEDALTRLAV
jgi:hypothetical protein